MSAIALTSQLIKIFEKVVRNAIVLYLEKYNLFNTTQHEFRFGHSCLSQLLAHYDRITELMEEGHDVDIIYVDVAKALDKVNNQHNHEQNTSSGDNWTPS